MDEELPGLVDELAGYEKAFELVPDAIVLGIAQNQDIASYIGLWVVLIFSVVAFIGLVVRTVTFKPAAIGWGLIILFVGALCLTPLDRGTLYVAALDQKVAFQNQPLGQFYLFKVLHAVNGAWTELMRNIAVYGTNGTPSRAIQRVLTDHYSDTTMKDDSSKELRRLWADYVAACANTAIRGISDGDITRREAGSIGLLGGSGLGAGYQFDTVLADEANDWDTQYGGYFNYGSSTSNAESQFTLLGDGGGSLRKDRKKAATYVWNHGEVYVDLPGSNYYVIYNRDHWISVLAAHDQDAAKFSPLLTGLSPAKIDVKEHPFGEMLKNPAPLDQFVPLAERQMYENVAYLDTCKKYYLAAESAVTAYYDAIHDYADWVAKVDQINNKAHNVAMTNMGQPVLISSESDIESRPFESRRARVRQGDVLHSSRAAYFAEAAVGQANRSILSRFNTSTRDNPEGLESEVQAWVEGGVHRALAWWDEWKKKFGILGAISINISLMSIIYFVAPLFFLLAAVKGIDMVIHWINLVLFSFIILMVNTLILTLGQIAIYRQFIDASLSYYQLHEGNGTIFLTNLNIAGYYYGTLFSIATVDILIAYFIVFKDTSGLRRMSSNSAGFVAGMGAVVGVVAYSALGAIKGKLFSGAAGGSVSHSANPSNGGPGGSGGGSPPNPVNPTPIASSLPISSSAANDTNSNVTNLNSHRSNSPFSR